MGHDVEVVAWRHQPVPGGVGGVLVAVEDEVKAAVVEEGPHDREIGNHLERLYLLGAGDRGDGVVDGGNAQTPVVIGATTVASFLESLLKRLDLVLVDLGDVVGAELGQLLRGERTFGDGVFGVVAVEVGGEHLVPLGVGPFLPSPAIVGGVDRDHDRVIQLQDWLRFAAGARIEMQAGGRVVEPLDERGAEGAAGGVHEAGELVAIPGLEFEVDVVVAREHNDAIVGRTDLAEEVEEGGELLVPVGLVALGQVSGDDDRVEFAVGLGDALAERLKSVGEVIGVGLTDIVPHPHLVVVVTLGRRWATEVEIGEVEDERH